MKIWAKRILIGLGVVLGVIVLSLLIAYFAAKGEYQVRPTVTHDKTLPRVTIDGVTFHAKTFGAKTAPVVIVLHGGPGNDYRYLLPLKALSSQYRVVFYDQRGTGLSARVPKKQLTLDNMIEDVRRIADHYSKTKPVRIVGHSWGAMLGSAFTGRYPKRVSHLVLAEPGLLTPDATKAFLRKFKFSLTVRGWFALTWLWLQSRHAKGPDASAPNDYFFTEMAKLDLPGNPMKGYACKGNIKTLTISAWRYNLSSTLELQGKGMAKPDAINLAKGIQKFKGKTLFLTGSCNSIIGTAHQRKYHLKLFPGATLQEIKDAGHTMIGERPKATLTALKTFLQTPIP